MSGFHVQLEMVLPRENSVTYWTSRVPCMDRFMLLQTVRMGEDLVTDVTLNSINGPRALSRVRLFCNNTNRIYTVHSSFRL
jgi:hypothetical protein